MEICDIINHTEEGPGDAAKAIKKRQALLNMFCPEDFTFIVKATTVHGQE